MERLRDLLHQLSRNRWLVVGWIAVKIAILIQFADETAAVIYQGF